MCRDECFRNFVPTRRGGNLSQVRVNLAQRSRRECEYHRLPRQDSEGALRLVPRRRTDFAEILGQDEIRFESAQELGVDGVDRSADAKLRGHRRVDLRRR